MLSGLPPTSNVGRLVKKTYVESVSAISSTGESGLESDTDSDSQDDVSDEETTPMPSLSKMVLTNLCNIRGGTPTPAHQTLAPPPESTPPPHPLKEDNPVTLPRLRSALPLERSPPKRQRQPLEYPHHVVSPKSLSRPFRKPHPHPIHAPNSPKPAPHPTIQVHFQVARLALLQRLLQTPVLLPPRTGHSPELQSLFDNPIPEDVAEAEFLLQPMIVTHRMFWQGAEGGVPEALALALDTSLTTLT
ncbi:hypothetical protein FA13DRAFT_1817445 [Coprinellus micaceus]|uniref:Uncharacterized protein n=1 Tax=Coprinellus micaceus TaxID=71717 RepID=A0A4Y7SVZ3_COPMI|nr:hypothetical protein FA13DRAFT_1817445 [Coprinellus micaceus]